MFTKKIISLLIYIVKQKPCILPLDNPFQSSYHKGIGQFAIAMPLDCQMDHHGDGVSWMDIEVDHP
jgi:hypothetical protein